MHYCLLIGQFIKKLNHVSSAQFRLVTSLCTCFEVELNGVALYILQACNYMQLQSCGRWG